MTEERKFAILFAATILAARKLIEMEPDKPHMAKACIVDKAIDDAANLNGHDQTWNCAVEFYPNQAWLRTSPRAGEMGV